jgi:hypothetical protein
MHYHALRAKPSLRDRYLMSQRDIVHLVTTPGTDSLQVRRSLQ